jgi:hypothetical protein
MWVYLFIKRIFALVACMRIFCMRLHIVDEIWFATCNVRVLMSLCVTFFNSPTRFEPFKALHLCKFRVYLWTRACAVYYYMQCAVNVGWPVHIRFSSWNESETGKLQCWCDWSRQFNELRWVYSGITGEIGCKWTQWCKRNAIFINTICRKWLCFEDAL